MGSSKKYSNGYWKLYVHINKENNKRYVGITSQKPEYRWNHGEAYKNNPHFYSAIKKYGWDDGFMHVILFDHLTEEEAKEAEIWYIAEWKTQDREYGYNVSAGGESCSGWSPPEELRKLWSMQRTGTKRSEETKARMRRSSAFNRPEVREKCLRNHRKKVSAYTMDGEYVGTWDSIVWACQALGLNQSVRGHISNCCKGERKSAGGYKWEYAQ